MCSFLLHILAEPDEGKRGSSLAAVVENLPLTYDTDSKNLGRTPSLGQDKPAGCRSPFTPGHIRRSSYESAQIQLNFARRTTTAKGTPAIAQPRCNLEASCSNSEKIDCGSSTGSDSAIGDSVDSNSKHSSLDRGSVTSDTEDSAVTVPQSSRSKLFNFPRNLFSMNRSEKPWKMFGGGKSNKTSSVVPPAALILEDRPSSLPAKSEEEAAKHRQLYWNMIEQSKKKEQRAEKERRQMRAEQKRLEEQAAAACRVWTEQILPKWEEMKNSKRCRELWWQGIPAKVRGAVWSRVIGNHLNITQEYYKIIENKARTRRMEQERVCEPNEHNSAQILLDASRTFPSLGIFQKGGPYHDHLLTLLETYACYRPDIGYVQSMPFIAGVLLLQMDPFPAFVAFANLLDKPLQSAFFGLRQPQMTEYFIAFDRYFEQELPGLHHHFDKLDVRPDLYLIEWIYTLYAKSLPLDIACRVWDVFLRDGEEFIFKTALGIMRMYETKLMSMDFGDGVEFLTKLPDSLSGPELFRNIEPLMRTSYENSKTKKSFSQIFTEVDEKINPGGVLPQSQVSSNVMGMRMSKSLSGFVGDLFGPQPPSS